MRGLGSTGPSSDRSRLRICCFAFPSAEAIASSNCAGFRIQGTKPNETRAQVARIARFTAKAIGLERDLRDDEIILDDRYHAGVYGIPDASTLEAMRLAARLEAMITDPVYEGKSMAGLIDPVGRGEIDRSSNVEVELAAAINPAVHEVLGRHGWRSRRARSRHARFARGARRRSESLQRRGRVPDDVR